MKTIFYLMISLLIVSTFCDEPSGVKIVVKDSSAYNASVKFLPRLIDLINQIVIADPDVIKVDVPLTTLYIGLSNIKIHIDAAPTDKIKVEFNAPNIIKAIATDITGSGSLDTKLKLLFVSETQKVTVKIKRLNLEASIKLGRIESLTEKGKYIPDGSIENINIDLDFDFDINGSILAGLATLAKSLIKSKLQDLIHGKIKQVIIEAVETIKKKGQSKLPVYVPILDNGLAVDYSLLYDPIIVDNNLILSSNGAIVNVKVPETLTPIYPLDDNLPQFDKDGKDVQVFVTEYSVNTAANSLYLTDLLKGTLETSDLPAESPVQFNSSTMDVLVNGLEAKYGAKKATELNCKAFEKPPVIKFLPGSVSASVSGDCILRVQLEDGTFEDVLNFTTEAIVLAEIKICSEGKLSAKAKSLKLTNSKTIGTKFPDTDIANIERTFNTLGYISLPIINEKYLKEIELPIPTVEGISFLDSTFEIKQGYGELNLTPVYS